MVATGLVVAVPGLYVVRTKDQRPLRGLWLGWIAAIVTIVPAIAWYRALQLGFASSAANLAIATTVPFAELTLMMLSLTIFKSVVGRPPAEFTFQGQRQDNVDTLMHGLMLAVAIAGIFTYASFRH